MTTANRRNALASTGPKTAEGKAAFALNATRHGILARLEVLPGVERPEDWNAHLDAVLDDLGPAGHLERSLFRTLHELQRLQAARNGGAVAPVAVDVTVDGGAAA